MIATERNGQFPSSSMGLDLRSDFSVDLANKPRTFHDTNRGVLLYSKLLELVMTSEFDLPAEAFDLIDQPSFHEMDWACVNACTRLSIREELNVRENKEHRLREA